MRKYLIISIDTECDKGPGWKVRHPLSFEGVYRGIGEILQPLFEEYGFRATYLISPEVMEDEASVGLLKDVLRRSAELGTHLHGEFVEPFRKEDVERTEELAADYSADVELEKLRNLTELFRSVFGFAPLSYRAGRFSISSRTVRFLEDLGYRVDSSLTPFSAVSGVDHTRAPVYPYYPDYTDIYRPGNSKILEVPITILPQNPLLFDILKSTPLFRFRRFRRWIKERYGNLWLRPTVSGASQVEKIVEIYRKMFPGRPMFFNMMFHNMEVVDGMSPYDAAVVRANLREILSYLRGHGFEPLTLKEVVDEYDGA